MEYNFKALVIDDEVQILSAFNAYERYLEKDGIHIDFDVINNEKNYDEKKPYDILLVDYDLKKGYSQKVMGDDFIQKFRKTNRISKVIFYSSSFSYDDVEKKYSLPFSTKQIFSLVNELKVDRIAYKNNFNMMVDVIKSCCEEIDILPVLLTKMVSKYKDADIKVRYTNSEGEEINVTELIDELLNDSKEGRIFREKITDTIMSVLFNFEY